MTIRETKKIQNKEEEKRAQPNNETQELTFQSDITN